MVEEQRTERILVIGADAAGMSAAHQAMRTARVTGRDVTVTVLEAGEHTSYSACGIPYVVSGEVGDVDDLVARTAEEHRAAGIDLRMNARVRRVDPEEQTVALADESRLGYDQLVVATGARAIEPEWMRYDGVRVEGVRTAKTLDDAEAWARAFGDARPGERVVVAGGGYIGVEMVEAALRRGLRVTLVTRSRVMSTFAPEMSDRITAALTAAGAEVMTGTEVVGLEVVDGRVAAALTADGRLECQHVVVALGVLPATDFLAHTGLLSPRGALRPDEHGRVAPGLWAAGDCCEVRTRDGAWTYAPLGTYANKAGRAVGENLAGGDREVPGVLGTAITRFAHGDVHVEMARTGPLVRTLAEEGRPGVTLTTEGTVESGYMPGAAPVALRLTADPATRALVAVEIVGGPGAGKRIDTAAAVIWWGGTVDDLAWMDLSYAPPVATASTLR